MKFLLSIFFALLVTLTYSQNRVANYKANDPSKNYGKPLTTEVLAHYLTDNYKTDKDKVRSVFTWITENISYKLKPWYATVGLKKMVAADEDTSTILKPLNERVAEDVLKTNRALCDGYARLFATLCSYAGVKAEVITGYARTNNGSAKFRSNHTWNAVFVDSAWHLLDATWASGYVTFQSDEFVRQYNANYFFTPPEEFIYDHYPENLEWTLLDNPPTLKEFNHAPFRSQRFVKSRLISYMPEKGIIDAAEGDTVKMEIQTEELMQDLESTYDPSFDSTVRSLPASWAFIRPTFSTTEKKLSYNYLVPSGDVKWINLVLHDDVVMRYKLNKIKKPKQVMPQNEAKFESEDTDLMCNPKD